MTYKVSTISKTGKKTVITEVTADRFRTKNQTFSLRYAMEFYNVDRRLFRTPLETIVAAIDLTDSWVIES